MISPPLRRWTLLALLPTFAVALSATLSGCGGRAALPPVASLPAPVMVADRTAADEKALIGAELAYKSLRIALEAATDAGRISGDRAAQAAVFEERAWQALRAARGAYAAGNATGFVGAIGAAETAIAAARAAIGGQ